MRGDRRAVATSFRQMGAVLGISVFVALLGVWLTFAALSLASGAVLFVPPFRRATRQA